MSVLPELPYEAWRPTKDTLHLYVQEVGKLKLNYAPPLNHWWHVTFAVTYAASRPGGCTRGTSASTSRSTSSTMRS